jgi:hypothetical protein
VALDQIAIFQLGISDECLQRVHALIKNDVYVYPGHWAVDKDGKVCFFLFSIHDLTLLSSLCGWSKTLSLTSKFKQYYMSSHLELKEPELTIPIVALGATAVCSMFHVCLDYH